MAEIERPNYVNDPVPSQRVAVAAVLIDPATGSPYNGNTGVITVMSLSEVVQSGEDVALSPESTGQDGVQNG
ncbi:hypothetical protein Gekk315_00041 [Aeromonas phage Gekk3-15]